MEVINKRLALSEKEIEEIKESDFFNLKIINGNFDNAYAEVRDNILMMYPNLQ